MAEHDGKVTFDLELDDSKLRGDLNRALGQLRNLTGGKLTVQADTQAAENNISRVAGAVRDLNASSPNIAVNADTQQAETNLNRVSGDVRDLVAEHPVIDVDAETQQAETDLGRVKALAQELDAIHPKIVVEADGSQVESVLTKSGGGGTSEGGDSLGTIAKEAAVGATAWKALSTIFSGGQAYDYGLQKVATLMPEGANKNAFGEGVLGLASKYGLSYEALLETAYNGLSGSVPYGDASGNKLLEYLDTAAKLNLGGYATLGEAGDLLTSAYNAYGGLYSYDAIANQAIKTQNKGKINVGQEGQSIAVWAPTAASAGIPLEQANAIWASLTAGGTYPAPASTEMAALFAEFLDTGSKGFETMQEAFKGTQYEGNTLRQAMDNGATFIDVVGMIGDWAKGNGRELQDNLFSSRLVGSAIASLTGTNYGRTQEDYAYISGQGDALSSAYGTMADTTRGRLGRLWAHISSAGIGLFEKGKPFLNGVLDSALGLLDNPMGLMSSPKSGESLEDYIGRQNERLQRAAFGGVLPNHRSSSGPTYSSGLSGSAITQAEGLMQFPKAADTAQAAASLNTAMEDLSADIEASAESAQTATEAQEQITESMDASAEANEKNAESAKRAAKQAETAASKGKTLATKFSSLSTSLMTAVSASSGLAGEISGLVANIRAASSAASSGGVVRPSQATAKAVGLDYVPYDNYPALLHKGEMILTAAQASAFRTNGGGGDGGAMTAQALRSALTGMAVEIDGRRAGALLERSVSRQQGVRLNRMNSRG